ncbi:MAG TPA: hypothetical protein VIZ58_04525 [Thermoanaerobaculia bacterium]
MSEARRTSRGPGLVPPPEERRHAQRRLAIGRRVSETRREIEITRGDAFEERLVTERLFDERRRRSDRRGLAPRRKLPERRAGVAVFDLRDLDLSELDRLF